MTKRILQLFLLLVIAGVLSLILDLWGSGDVRAQAEPTPLPLAFPTAEPLQTRVENVATAIPTFTPTEPGPPVLRAREGSGDINLREAPDPTGEVVGTLRVGEEYEVTGTYFLWYRLRYPDARTNEAYVFGELVEIIGDPSTIPDLTQVTLEPTINPAFFGPTETREALELTPGFDATLTASVREIAAPGESNGSNGGSALPTFTFPPDIVAQAPTLRPADAETGADVIMEDEGVSVDVSGDIAPIVPIAILAGLGVIGLLLSLLRRG